MMNGKTFYSHPLALSVLRSFSEVECIEGYGKINTRETLRYTVLIFFLSVTCACAMDLTMVTFKPKRRFEKRSLVLQISNLPVELQSKVFKNIIYLTIHEYEKTKKCIDAIELNKYNLNKLLLGIECAQEFHQLQKMCQREIGDKKFLAQELLILPCHEREVFIRMANRSKIRSFIASNIGGNDFKKLVIMKNENIKKGLRLKTRTTRNEMLLYFIIGSTAMMLQWFPMVMIFSKANFVMEVSTYFFLSSYPLLIICALFFKHDKGFEERFYRG